MNKAPMDADRPARGLGPSGVRLAAFITVLGVAVVLGACAPPPSRVPQRKATAAALPSIAPSRAQVATLALEAYPSLRGIEASVGPLVPVYELSELDTRTPTIASSVRLDPTFYVCSVRSGTHVASFAIWYENGEWRSYSREYAEARQSSDALIKAALGTDTYSTMMVGTPFGPMLLAQASGKECGVFLANMRTLDWGDDGVLVPRDKMAYSTSELMRIFLRIQSLDRYRGDGYGAR